MVTAAALATAPPAAAETSTPPPQDPSTVEYERPPTLEELEPQPQGHEGKLQGHELWEAIGKPKYVVAPMVDQSELAWRILSRVHGANLCYTPMFHAASFATQPKSRHEAFDLSPDSIEGVAPYDRPLVVQFCANDKEHFLNAAKHVTDRCDAVDLNLGCPQGIAKRGHYGAFLMEEWNLIRSLISHLHQNLTIPIIAKIRVFPSVAKTLHYASHVYSSGAQLVTVHGRTREAKGPQTGLASWDKIRRVVDLLSPKVPVLANGGIPSSEEVEPCLEETGAYGVMSAEGNLYNPMLFAPHNAAAGRTYASKLPEPMRSALQACEQELDLASGAGWDRDHAAYAPATFLAQQYLAIVTTLPSTKTATSAIKAHLYKLFRPVWAAGRHPEMRESLGRAGGISGTMEYLDRVKEFQDWVDQFRELLKADREAGLLPADSNRPLTHAEVQTLFGGVIPYSHSQPYLRVTQPAGSKEELELKAVDDAAKRKREVEELGAIDPAAEAKRSKPSPASPPATAPAAGEAVPAPSTFPCTTPSCTNAAAGKCSNRVCKTCCASLRSPTSTSSTSTSPSSDSTAIAASAAADAPTTGAATPATATDTSTVHPCEFHETKEAKERELAVRRKEMQKLKRQRGKLKAVENDAKVKALNEQKRKERREAEQQQKKKEQEEEPAPTASSTS